MRCCAIALYRSSLATVYGRQNHPLTPVLPTYTSVPASRSEPARRTWNSITASVPSAGRLQAHPSPPGPGYHFVWPFCVRLISPQTTSTTISLVMQQLLHSNLCSLAAAYALTSALSNATWPSVVHSTCPSCTFDVTVGAGLEAAHHRQSSVS